MTEHGYSIRKLPKQWGVGKSTLGKWARQYRQERHGLTPKGSKALTAKLQEMQQMVKQTSYGVSSKTNRACS